MSKKLNIIFGYLSINYLQNKLDLPVKKNKERKKGWCSSNFRNKLDDAFLESQFKTGGFALSFRKDRNQFGEGIMFFIRKDNPGKLLLTGRAVFMELNLHMKKWLLCCAFKPDKNNILNDLNVLRKSFYLFSA